MAKTQGQFLFFPCHNHFVCLRDYAVSWQCHSA